VNASRVFLLISRLFIAVSISPPSRSKKSYSPEERNPKRGILTVTTPTDPVKGAEPKSPPPLRRSSRLSILNLQHMLLASSGFISEWMKLAK